MQRFFTLNRGFMFVNTMLWNVNVRIKKYRDSGSTECWLVAEPCLPVCPCIWKDDSSPGISTRMLSFDQYKEKYKPNRPWDYPPCTTNILRRIAYQGSRDDTIYFLSRREILFHGITNHLLSCVVCVCPFHHYYSFSLKLRRYLAVNFILVMRPLFSCL
jgi:hypothetical protein